MEQGPAGVRALSPLLLLAPASCYQRQPVIVRCEVRQVVISLASTPRAFHFILPCQHLRPYFHCKQHICAV